jgi:nucleoside-diphosphate-sugar epimerase
VLTWNWLRAGWNDTTAEEALVSGLPTLLLYAASKALAEKEVWKFADEHPDLNITTGQSFALRVIYWCLFLLPVLPSLFSGDPAPGQLFQPGDTSALSTLPSLYNLILPDSKLQTSTTGYTDVRDVAIALVAGITAPGRNRALLVGEWFEVKDAVDYIAAARPELKDRLPTLVPTGQKEPIIDRSKAEKVLGFKVRPWQETVLTAVDFFVNLEKEWLAQGIDIENKLKKNGWNR